MQRPMRDRFNLTRAQMLEDYVAIARTRPGAASATAIRSGSSQYLEILASWATDGLLDWVELHDILMEVNELEELRSVIRVPTAALEIGRAILMQPQLKSLFLVGERALRHGLQRSGSGEGTREDRALLVRHLLDRHRIREATELLDRWGDVDELFDGYLRAEGRNPWVDGGVTSFEAWLDNFNAPFIRHGLSPVAIPFAGLPDHTPFDNLTCRAGEGTPESVPIDSSPLVSVIVLTDDSSQMSLATAVRSLCEQSHGHLEILVVHFTPFSTNQGEFEAVESLDARVRVLTREGAGGPDETIAAGLAEARGDYVTLQRGTDWSHPERIRLQLRALETDSLMRSNEVHGVVCGDVLDRVRREFASPVEVDPFTLMWRAGEDVPPVALTKGSGGPAGLGLNTAPLGESASRNAVIEKPLSLIRMSKPVGASLQGGHGSTVDTAQAGGPAYDVVLAGDWTRFGGPQKSMLEELQALSEAGLRLAVLHMDAARFMSLSPRLPVPAVRRELQRLGVHELTLDDVATVKLLILRYPPILQFARDQSTRLAIKEVLILANQAPSELDGRDIRYLVMDAHRNAERIFGSRVSWVPQGPAVREAIAPYLDDGLLEEFDLPGLIDLDHWKATRTLRRSSIPVVGRHSRDNEMKWPENPKELLQAYPVDGSLDVRIMGGVSQPLRVLEMKSPPMAWTCYPPDSMSVVQFLNGLDFFVFFQHSLAVEAFGRAILEAIASGLVVVLPPKFEVVFGPAAVYCEPGGVTDLIRQYHADSVLYDQQSEMARTWAASKFGRREYASFVDARLGASDSWGVE